MVSVRQRSDKGHKVFKLDLLLDERMDTRLKFVIEILPGRYISNIGLGNHVSLELLLAYLKKPPILHLGENNNGRNCSGSSWVGLVVIIGD